MTISCTPAADPFSGTDDRRLFSRLALALLGRYRLATRQDYPCLCLDISLSGLALLAPVKGPLGERIVVHLEQVGSLHGQVVRHTAQGFALSIKVTPAENRRLTARLKWLADKQRRGLADARRHRRIVPMQTAVLVRLPSERTVTTRLIDVSRGGAALRLEPQPPVETTITLGATPGRIVRRFDGAVAVEFLTPLAPERFNETILL